MTTVELIKSIAFDFGWIVSTDEWKSHATLTPLAKQDCPPLATI